MREFLIRLKWKSMEFLESGSLILERNYSLSLKSMFDRLKNEGITYRELNQKVKNFEIGGSSNRKLVIIDEIKGGDFIVKNVVAKVSLDTN